VFLLCSDGLHGLVEESDIARIVEGHAVLTEACTALVKLANERGGRDNITVVLVRIEETEEPWRSP
jgi:protein phosphatase